jgi:hypothetical protein
VDNTHAKKVAARKTKEINPDELIVRLPEGMRKALGELAAVLEPSGLCDIDAVGQTKELAAGHTRSAYDVVCALPLITQATFEYVHKTGDKRAEAAWMDVITELLEHRFTLEQPRSREK